MMCRRGTRHRGPVGIGDSPGWIMGVYLGILRVGESDVVLEVGMKVFFCGYWVFGSLF